MNWGEMYPAPATAQSRSGPEEKGTPVGVVDKARGPALGSWEDRPPAAYQGQQARRKLRRKGAKASARCHGIALLRFSVTSRATAGADASACRLGIAPRQQVGPTAVNLGAQRHHLTGDKSEWGPRRSPSRAPPL
eukprot:2403951-Pyramimonas_sp.AAC.1